jgi:hypothetical protein
MVTSDRVVGFAFDVSGSMSSSIENLSGGAESRLDSIRGALDTLLAEAEQLVSSATKVDSATNLYFFAYAFGLKMGRIDHGDLFRLLELRKDMDVRSASLDALPGKYRGIAEKKKHELQLEYERRLRGDERAVAIEVMGSSAYRLLSMSRAEAEHTVRQAIERRISDEIFDAVVCEATQDDLTLSLSDLVERWDVLRDGVSMSNDVLGGFTPMRTTLSDIAGRFRREKEGRPGAGFTLFIVSDGDATDGDPRGPIRVIAAAGVRVISCFVSSQDIVGGKRLYAEPEKDWPGGARTMFDIASVLPDSGPEAEYLARVGWQASPGSRMFAQINQSNLLSEFMNVVIAPIRAEQGKLG